MPDNSPLITSLKNSRTFNIINLLGSILMGSKINHRIKKFCRDLSSRLFHGVRISGRLLKISGPDMICDDPVQFRLRSKHHGVRSVNRLTRTKACHGFFLDSREQIAYAPSEKVEFLSSRLLFPLTRKTKLPMLRPKKTRPIRLSKFGKYRTARNQALVCI